MAGYSGTPLAKKLGIKEGSKVSLFRAPEGFERDLAPLPSGVDLRRESRRSRVDVVIWFVDRQVDLAARLGVMRDRIAANGGLWVAWPKRSSGVATDLDGNIVRELILASGLVDNKVCAIDLKWSGLRGVYRLRDRT
ncbi:MAG: DUF3052 family protein [Thermoanaerobaculia bacterium]|nr:DUF3052 family protein [Thermoanaerobaculia bacterium]